MVKVVCVLLVVVVGYLQAAKLPKFIVPCSKSDPNLNECAKKHAQDAIPSILPGNRKFKIPNLTPLSIKEENFTAGDLHGRFTNITLHGLERTKIEEVHIDLENHDINITVSIDEAAISADYNVLGTLLTVPISRNGTVNITLVGGEYTYHFNYTLKDKKKGQYLVIKDDEFSFKGGKGHFQFDGEEKETDEPENKDWESVKQAVVGSALSEAVSNVIKSIITGFTNRIPFHRFFLP